MEILHLQKENFPSAGEKCTFLFAKKRTFLIAKKCTLLFPVHKGISQDGYSAYSDVFIKRLNADIYSITKIGNDDLILYSGFLKSKKPLIKSGIFSFYSSSGHLTAIGCYNNDILIGEWIYYDTKTDSIGRTLYGTQRIVDYDEVHTYMKKERDVKPPPGSNTGIWPTYNGGYYILEFKKYVENNMIYPTYLKYEGIEGRVIIQFRIDKNGEVRQASIINSNHVDFSIEALRLAIEAPDWEPGLRDGRPVDFIINVQIDFRLK